LAYILCPYFTQELINVEDLIDLMGVVLQIEKKRMIMLGKVKSVEFKQNSLPIDVDNLP
jgi:hypothetical protein